MVFEVDADEPDLSIVQVTSNRKLAPGGLYSFQFEVRNKGNSPLIVLLDAEVEGASGWNVDIGGPTSSRLIELDAFEEVTFTLEVSVPSSANNGDTAKITITAEPHDTEQSWPDEFTAEKISIWWSELMVFDRLINEVTNPRASTLIVMVVSILLIFAGVQSRMNRRKWAAHLALIEAMKEAENDDSEVDSEEDSETPIVEEEEEEEMVYDDDDIELV